MTKKSFLISLMFSMSKMRVMKVIKKTSFFVSPARIQKYFDLKRITKKMSSVMICVLTINEKPGLNMARPARPLML